MNREQIAPRIELATFTSQALQRPMQFSIVLPDDYSPAPHTDIPVVYFLHGRGRTCRSLIDNPQCRAALLQSRHAIVLPQGDDGWYINSPTHTQDRYADYLHELMDLAAATYHLSRNPHQRALAGWSMGGFGAAYTCTQHPEQFAALATIIALLDFPRQDYSPNQGYTVPTERFSSDQTYWQTVNPIQHARALADKPLLIITADQAFDRVMNDNFSQQLSTLNIDHTYTTLTGGHTFDVVQQAVPLVINFMNRCLQRHPLP